MLFLHSHLPFWKIRENWQCGNRGGATVEGWRTAPRSVVVAARRLGRQGVVSGLGRFGPQLTPTAALISSPAPSVLTTRPSLQECLLDGLLLINLPFVGRVRGNTAAWGGATKIQLTPCYIWLLICFKRIS